MSHATPTWRAVGSHKFGRLPAGVRNPRATHRWLRAVVAVVVVGTCVIVGATTASHSAAARAGRAPAGEVAATNAGLVRGASHDGYRTFQGIPFAAPAVGRFRWASPQPVKPWAGVRNATRPSASCPQIESFGEHTPSETEDCLYLNVTVPKVRAHERLPVLVYLFPGGFVQGDAATYQAARMATQGHVMVVTPNYRLGLLGFLAHPALDKERPELSGNYGLQDQQAALRWVRRNAAAFGGDPSNVTLSGTSAGGISTCAQLFTPSSAGLFDRAILQSGPCPLTTTWAYPNEFFGLRRDAAERLGMRRAAALGCTDVRTAAACLRAKSVSKLLDPELVESAGPTVGGGLLPYAGRAPLADGRFTRVPVMVGVNRDEVRLHAAAEASFGVAPRTQKQYQDRIIADFGAAEAKRILAEYPMKRYGSAAVAWATLTTDHTWSCGVRDNAGALGRHTPTYTYEFADRHAPWTTLDPEPAFPTGAFHSAEAQYLYEDKGYPALDRAQLGLSTTMIRYWSNFARSGNPNGLDVPRWKRFDEGEYVQSLAPGVGGVHRVALGTEHRCGFWRSIGQT